MVLHILVFRQQMKRQKFLDWTLARITRNQPLPNFWLNQVLICRGIRVSIVAVTRFYKRLKRRFITKISQLYTILTLMLSLISNLNFTA
jgi:hypothetical protein